MLYYVFNLVNNQLYISYSNKEFYVILFSCENRCETGSPEAHCTSKCKCQNDAGCNTETGTCHCKPGWKVCEMFRIFCHSYHLSD